MSDAVPQDLAAPALWRYRATIAGQPGPWSLSMGECLAPLASERMAVTWPEAWSAFGPWEPATHGPADYGDDPLDRLATTVPTHLSYRGVTQERREVFPTAAGIVDLVPIWGPPHAGRMAFLVAVCNVTEAGEYLFHLSADYWMDCWLDGRRLLSTLATGNGHALLANAHRARCLLDAGRHVLAIRCLSGNGGWALAAEVQRVVPGVVPPTSCTLEALCQFQVTDPTNFASLTLRGYVHDSLRLNGRPLPVPFSSMHYDVITGIPASLLQPGPNVLSYHCDARISQAGHRAASLRYFHASGDDLPLRTDCTLLGMPHAAGRIQTGPLLAGISADALDISCRTDACVPVELVLAGRRVYSPAGIIHRFHVTGLAPGHEYPFEVFPTPAPDAVREGSARTLPTQAPTTIAIVADAGPLPAVWAQVANAVLKQRPHLLVFHGDLVSEGSHDAQWDQTFFGPAAELFAQVPLYPVPGNHDERSALLSALFPRAGSYWAQSVGPMLLVGIDSSWTGAAAEAQALWLERTLAASMDRFIFVFNHYPAWSSGPHLMLDAQGHPVELPCRAAREVIVPILRRHHATALFSGHDHFYERSELPGALTAFITGGAGAYLYGPSGAARSQNPYSRVLVAQHHFCMLEADTECCRLRALTPTGELLDSTTWKPRTGVPSDAP